MSEEDRQYNRSECLGLCLGWFLCWVGVLLVCGFGLGDWERELSKAESSGGDFRFPPLVSSLLVLAYSVAFLLTFLSNHPEGVFAGFGFVPGLLSDLSAVPRLFSYMFLHADIFHILMNMLVFLSFAPAVEDRIGKLRFLGLFLMTGVASALFYFVFNASSLTPVVGASGATFGVLAAFVVLFPEEKVFLYLFGAVPVKVPAIVGIPFIFVVETVLATVLSWLNPNVASLAHVGGFISGLLFVALIYAKSTKEFLKDFFSFLRDIMRDFAREVMSDYSLSVRWYCSLNCVRLA